MKVAISTANSVLGVSYSDRGVEKGSEEGLKGGGGGRERDKRNALEVSSTSEYQEQERLKMKSVQDAKKPPVATEDLLPMVWRVYGRTVIEGHYFNSLKKCFEPLLENLGFSVLVEKVRYT